MPNTPWIGELGRDGRPAISKNGNFIAFGKDNEIDVYNNRLVVVKNVTLSGASPGGNYSVLGISGDGEKIYIRTWNGFLTGGAGGIYEVTASSGATQRLDIDQSGNTFTYQGWSLDQDDFDISNDGTKAVFVLRDTEDSISWGTQRTHIWLKDLGSGTVERIDYKSSLSEMGYSSAPRINSNGSKILFLSDMSLTEDTTSSSSNIYLWEQGAGITLINKKNDGTEITSNYGWHADIDSSGNQVVFQTHEALVSSDTNGISDVYLKNLNSGAITKISEGSNGGIYPELSQDGNYIYFQSYVMTENYLKCYDIENSIFINIPGVDKKNSPSFNSESYEGISSNSGLFWTWKDYSATDSDNDADYYYFDLSDPTYTITQSVSAGSNGAALWNITTDTPGVFEGDILTTSISTTNVNQGTTLYYSLSGIGITSSDFSSGDLTGSGIVDSSGNFSFSHTVGSDTSTEGDENLNIKLFSDSELTSQLGATATVKLQEAVPTYSITPSESTINEGGTLTNLISTTNVAEDTTLYYSLSGTGITSDDFTSGSLTGSGTVDSNGDFSFSHTLYNELNSNIEGDENLDIKLFSDSSLSTQVGETQTVTIQETKSYTIGSSYNSSTIGEGDYFSTTVSTTNVAADTTLYWSLSGTGITSSDISSGELTGSGTVLSYGYFSTYISFSTTEDKITEGNETLEIKLFSDSDRTTQVGSTKSISITDTSKTPSYTITPSATSIDEGDLLTTSISTENVSNYTTLYYALSGTGITSSDFYSGWLTGSGNTSSDGKFSFSHRLSNDLVFEGNETLEIKLYSDSSRSTQVGETSTVEINDTSKTTSYTITPSTTSINEGDTFTTSISTTGLEEDSILYWSISGTGITSSDFSSGDLTGSGAVDGDGNFSFSHTLMDDSLYEGKYESFYIKLFSDSSRSTEVASKWISIGETYNSATFNVNPSTSTLKEGETLEISISTINVSEDITLYYTFSGEVDGNDFTNGPSLIYRKPFTIDSNGNASISLITSEDGIKEEDETFVIKIYDQLYPYTYGELGSSSSITIANQFPVYTITPSTNNIQEGNTLTTSISTTNLEEGTTLYYSFSGNGITSSDFSSGDLTGSGTIDSEGNFSISHTIAEDLSQESDESLDIKLFSDSGRSTQVASNSNVTITDKSTIYSLSTNDPSVIESDTNSKTLTFLLTLDQEAKETTNINYQTLTTGTAASGEDFVSAAGVVTFIAGQQVASLNITINGDELPEDNETINVKFSSSKLNQDVIATGTITNNDIAASSYSASVDEPSIVETDSGNRTLTYTITLDQAVSEDTNINYQVLTTGSATSGEDFMNDAGVVTFLKGQKVGTVNVSVYGDSEVESNETIQVKFSGSKLSSEVIATGTIKNNDIAGTDSDDDINGTSGDDNISGGGGIDKIDGGAGDDIISYTGNFKDYSITKTTTTIQITDTRITSPDGVDTIQNIEYVQFTDQLVAADKVNVVNTYSGNFRDYKFYNKGDGTYEIKNSSTGTTDDITGIPKLIFDDKTADESVSAIADIKGVFDQVTGLNTDSGEMFRLYNAAFARFPDADGLKYWIGNFSSGKDDSRAVASSFLASTEFKDRYGDSVSHTTYVNNLYSNVLGRLPDTSGLNYWLDRLNTGAETRYEVLLGFSESSENKGLFTEMTGFG